MALPILDGNQSATTLSSILTSGEHIPAHTVVSLGTQAITDISGAVSGSVVSISLAPCHLWHGDGECGWQFEWND
jgi:hypothetical protein